MLNKQTIAGILIGCCNLFIVFYIFSWIVKGVPLNIQRIDTNDWLGSNIHQYTNLTDFTRFDIDSLLVILIWSGVMGFFLLGFKNKFISFITASYIGLIANLFTIPVVRIIQGIWQVSHAHQALSTFINSVGILLGVSLPLLFTLIMIFAINKVGRLHKQ